MPEKLLISSVEDAISEFMAIASDEKGVEFDEIVFADNVAIKIRLPNYKSEIPAPFIDAYYRQQQQLLRLAALIETGNSDIKSLSSSQREKYQFKVKVTEGSSEFDENTRDLLTKMATAAFGKMTGKQAAITILGVALIGGTTWGATSFIEAQKQIRLSEIASQERQKTISDLTSSMESQADQYAKILDTMRANGEFSSRGADTAEAINSGRLRAASGVDETEIGGIHISGDQARELRASLRRKSSKRTVTQDMRVVDVNTADPASTTIILEDPITGDQVKVTYSDRLVQDSQRGIVHSALQERTPASFTLKVTEIEGDIISTEIVAVKPAENEYED